MGSIQSRQAAIGYQTANQRPSCRNCRHSAEVFADHAAPTEGPRWECDRYGFRVTATAICNRHEPKTAAPGPAEFPRTTGHLGVRQAGVASGGCHGLSSGHNCRRF